MRREWGIDVVGKACRPTDIDIRGNEFKKDVKIGWGWAQI
jgi:hypothetical protein